MNGTMLSGYDVQAGNPYLAPYSTSLSNQSAGSRDAGPRQHGIGTRLSDRSNVRVEPGNRFGDRSDLPIDVETLPLDTYAQLPGATNGHLDGHEGVQNTP